MREQKKKRFSELRAFRTLYLSFQKNVNIWTEFPNLSQIMHGGKAQMCGSIVNWLYFASFMQLTWHNQYGYFNDASFINTDGSVRFMALKT